MKLTLSLLAVIAACCVSAVPLLDKETQVSKTQLIPFIDEAGVEQVIDSEEEPDEDFLEELEQNDINRYVLFTRSNPENGQEITHGIAASISESNFDASKKTAVVAHGWLNNEESGLNRAIVTALLSADDCNVIVLDWSRLARRNYITSFRGVPTVGRRLGRFVGFLNSRAGLSLDNVHLIGFSLGAHLVGNAGRELEGKVARITALDPAGPLWNLNSNRIQSSDAVYVEGIHTDGGLVELSLGLGLRIGDVDFFPNGGNNQPGCWTSSICSHNRAWRIFAASVSYNHLEGRRCSNVMQMTLNLCRGDRLRMGNNELKKNGSGRYRVNTRRRYPY
ncbi:hypothetical protein evm_008858 [Chilo suppressalis]|nr:hypothetical protein evm_008858 [Chilo suppressalis]